MDAGGRGGCSRGEVGGKRPTAREAGTKRDVDGFFTQREVGISMYISCGGADCEKWAY